MAEWFRRQSAKIKTTDRREIAEGMWLKCPQCNEVLYRTMLEENYFICTNCSYHFRINCNDYIQLLIDNDQYEEIAKDVQSVDPLNFKATKHYTDQLQDAQELTGNKDAVAEHILGMLLMLLNNLKKADDLRISKTIKHKI